MRSSHTRLGRLGVAVATTVVVASLAAVMPASAATVTISGGSAEKIVLTLSAETAAFGSAMTPAGDEVGGEVDGQFVEGSDPSEGACYVWDGYIRVKSNKLYDVNVAGSVNKTRLFFDSTEPTNYATCVGGELVDTAMFTGGVWVNDNARTARTTHDYFLGAQVLWTDQPSSTLADVTLTITVSAAS